MNSCRLIAVSLLVILSTVTVCADGDAEPIRALRMQSNEAIARHDVQAIPSFLNEEHGWKIYPELFVARYRQGADC